MISIKLKGKAANYDRHCITRIWFSESGARLFYTTSHDRAVLELRTRDIDTITTDEEK
jgi:hypothetical protein